MKNLTLKMKLTVGFGAMLAISMAGGAVSYYSFRKVTDLAAYSDQRGQSRFYSTSIEALVNDQKAEYRGFLLTDQQTEMIRFQRDSQQIKDYLGKLDLILAADQDKALAAHVREVIDNYHSKLDHVIAVHRNGDPADAMALYLAPDLEAVRVDMAKSMEDLVELQSQHKAKARADEAATESWCSVLLLSLALSGIVVGAVVATLITRSITSSVSVMSNLIQEVADHNLTVADMEITSQDELGKAGSALNQMKNNLRQMIQSIAGTAEHVASASEQLSSSASTQAQSAETQKDQATQAATAMQEMSSTVLQVSENSNKAAEASRQAAETARHGGAIVEETLSKMRVIADSVGATAKKMEELGKSSDQIGRIIGVIDDIADQTNLLALNAAIEAARAGEQGRGFAVVADEVRKLAERTTTATKEIAHMIKNIQDETKTAVAAMEAGTMQVEDGVKSTAQAGDSLKEIIQMSEQVGEMITHIATAATEQSSASEEINNNMEQIAKLVKESSVGAQQSARACQDLSGLALDLQQMVGNFKLDDGNGSIKRGVDRAGWQRSPSTQLKALASSAG